MYTLKTKGKEFTIPKENLKYLAMTQAMDRKASVRLNNQEEAIQYLESIGIEVIE